MLISYYANKKSSPRLPSWQPSLIFFNIPIESGTIKKPCTLKHFQVTYMLHKAGYWTIRSMTISQHWLKRWFGAIRQHPNTSTNVDSNLLWHMASIDHNDLTLYIRGKSQRQQLKMPSRHNIMWFGWDNGTTPGTLQETPVWRMKHTHTYGSGHKGAAVLLPGFAISW